MAIPLSTNCLSAKPEKEENSSTEHKKHKNFKTGVDAFGPKNKNMVFGGTDDGAEKKVDAKFPAAAGVKTP